MIGQRIALVFFEMNMKKASLKFSTLILTGVLVAACSESKDSEKPSGLDDAPLDGGADRNDGEAPSTDGGDERDADIEDAREELVPIDADRGEGDGGDAEPGDAGDGEPDAPAEPECIFDEDCETAITVGICELPKCTAGVCGTIWAPRAYPCDDGLECSSGGLCEEGVCTSGQPDISNPDCVEQVVHGALWLTEVMGRPLAIDDSVDAVEGQWVEITSRAAKEVHLQDVLLVYFEWASGESEPDAPTYAAFPLGDASLSPGDSLLVARTFDPSLNGGIRAPFAYGNAFEFKGDRNGRLLLVAPEWIRQEDLPLGSLPNGPIKSEYTIDSVLIPAGTFGDANRGRSWQLSVPLPTSPEARVWCHTPADAAHAYVEEGALRNYGTPGQDNQSCSP